MPKKHNAIWPNIITAFSLACGLFVIFKTNMTEPGTATYSEVLFSVSILLFAALLDMFDGAVARIMKVESDFGGMFDSLADAVSFGVAPSVVILKTFSFAPHTAIHFFLMTGAIIYSICGVLRLVRFTVTRQKIQGNEEEIATARCNFTGLPITAAASISICTMLFLMSNDVEHWFAITDTTRAIIAIAVFFILGYFMISRWKFLSFKSLRIEIGSFKGVLFIAFATALILLGAIHHIALVLFVLSWGYLITAWVLSIARLIAGKRLKALDEFDPEPDDEDEEIHIHE